MLKYEVTCIILDSGMYYWLFRGWLHKSAVESRKINDSLSGVCRQCFVQCYECAHGYLDEICASIKRGEDSTVPNLGDNTAAYVYSDTFKSALTEMARSEYIFLNHEQIAALQIPNTVQSLSCYAWMSSFFKLTGDVMPNSIEIHLEACEIKEIHAEVIILIR